MSLAAVLLGRMGYAEALALQEKLVALRQQQRIPDTLLLVEHPPVLTVGRGGKQENILVPQTFIREAGVSVYPVTRGGDVTYHGPGQIVGYPILDLKARGIGIRAYVWDIEEVFIRLLAREFGIEAHRETKKYTGVWVGNAKITAIGIAVQRWVSMHGFAFNVNTDLSHFGWIRPCGITDRGVTSLQRILGKKQNLEKVDRMVLSYFGQVFKELPKVVDISELLGGEPFGEKDTATQTGLA